jgi:hypothetical protein
MVQVLMVQVLMVQVLMVQVLMAPARGTGTWHRLPQAGRWAYLGHD